MRQSSNVCLPRQPTSPTFWISQMHPPRQSLVLLFRSNNSWKWFKASLRRIGRLSQWRQASWAVLTGTHVTSELISCWHASISSNCLCRRRIVRQVWHWSFSAGSQFSIDASLIPRFLCRSEGRVSEGRCRPSSLPRLVSIRQPRSRIFAFACSHRSSLAPRPVFAKQGRCLGKEWD